MPFLIDGHNLIPHIRGLSLSQLDDELALLGLLNSFLKGTQKSRCLFRPGCTRWRAEYSARFRDRPLYPSAIKC